MTEIKYPTEKEIEDMTKIQYPTEEEMEAHKEKMEREEMEWKKEHPGTKRRL